MPSGFRTNAPWLAASWWAGPLTSVAVRVSPKSTSLSLSSTDDEPPSSTETLPFIGTEAVSPTATGGELLAVALTVKLSLMGGFTSSSSVRVTTAVPALTGVRRSVP